MRELQTGFIRMRIFRGWQHIATWDVRAVPRVDEYLNLGSFHGRRQINDVTYNPDATVDVQVSR
jgi:hypothetical protein